MWSYPTGVIFTMSDNTQAPPDQQAPQARQGFILDKGPCCHRCLDRTKEDIYSLPWLLEGEHYNCIRCETKFMNVG